MFWCEVTALLSSNRFFYSMNNEDTSFHVWLSSFLIRIEEMKGPNSLWSFRAELIMANVADSSSYDHIEDSHANCDSSTGTCFSSFVHRHTSWSVCSWSKTVLWLSFLPTSLVICLTCPLPAQSFALLEVDSHPIDVWKWKRISRFYSGLSLGQLSLLRVLFYSRQFCSSKAHRW